MAAGTGLYRVLVRLYPRDFRSHYGDDMVLHFTDLVHRDGPSATWRRAALDLLVTVPRYRLESIMSTRRATSTLVALVIALVVAAVGAFAAGFVPVAIVALMIAVAIVVSERSQLGRSLRPAGPRQRCALTLVVGLVDLGGRDSWPAGRLIAYNVSFLATGLGAMACLAVGLRRPAAAST
jgi:hypothetical protein